ncbi:MAG: sigma-70 family RNA polymerase sigma factor [Candidatus Peregrinibacteria bacterium]
MPDTIRNGGLKKQIFNLDEWETKAVNSGTFCISFRHLNFFQNLFTGKQSLENLQNADENTLARESQKGNTEAFEILSERTISRVFLYFSRRLDDHEVCEDLTSETLWKILNSLDKWSGDENFYAWGYTIAKYSLYDFLREKYKNQKISFSEMGEEAENLTVPEEEERNNADDFEKESLLNTLLEILPVQHQNVLRLRYLQGYTQEAVAQELGLSLANVKVIQHRSLQKIRNKNPDFQFFLKKCNPLTTI